MLNIFDWLTNHFGFSDLVSSGGVPDLAGAPAGMARPLDSIPAAWACIAILSGVMSTLPMQVVRYRDDDDPEYFVPVHNHYINGLLDAPSSQFDTYQFWLIMFQALFGRGNGYAWIERDVDGVPVQLHPVRCLSSWWERPQGVGGGFQLDGRLSLIYRTVQFLDGFRSARVPDRDLISLHGLGFNGLEAPSPIAYAARDVLQTMAYADRFNLSSLRLGVSGAYVTVDAEALLTLPKEQREQYIMELSNTVNEKASQNRILVMPPGVDFGQQSGLSASDRQLIEQLHWSIEDVARVFGVPPRLIGHYIKGVRIDSRFSDQAEDFERWSIRHRARMVGSQLTRKLLSPRHQALRYGIRLSTDRVSEGSFSDRVDAAVRAYANGGLATQNEGRRMMRLSPREDGNGTIIPKGAGGSTIDGGSNSNGGN